MSAPSAPSTFPIREINRNLFAGLTVSLAMVPESVAFALVAHVSPLTGLYAAFIVALITAAWGGRPGMISGSAGSLAVVSVALVVQHGIEYLFLTVVLMGLLQMLFAAARLGKFIRMVPHPVMLGFVNGLAIVIFTAQLGHLKMVGADGQPHWMTGAPLYTMLGLIVLTMLLIYLVPKLTKAIPSTLVAIVVVSVLVNALALDTKTVGDLGAIKGGLPQFHLPSVPWNWDTARIVLPYALILAAVGLIESLLTLNLVDDMTGSRGLPNRESMALGAANVVTGFFGGMGGCAMIGQTIINLNCGGLRRLSGIMMAACLLVFILFASRWIERIPLAALIGVMFVVAEKTFAWGSLRLFGRVPRPDIVVGILVALLTVVYDLAVGVLAGVVLSALVFAWQHAKQIRATSHVDSTGEQAGWKVYALDGTLFFASSAAFLALFTPEDDPQHVVIDFARARVADHSALEAIEALALRYGRAGRQLHLRHLSADCRELLHQARELVEVDVLGDPVYRVAADPAA